MPDAVRTELTLPAHAGLLRLVQDYVHGLARRRPKARVRPTHQLEPKLFRTEMKSILFSSVIFSLSM